MRNKGIRLFKIFGIQIALDFSWFIIFFLVTWTLASGYFPFKYPFLGVREYWIMGIISSLLLFITVLLHELSHSVVANQNGMDIHGIKLFIFGGIAQLTKEPHNPRVEFDVAIAGPICSFVLHFIFMFIAKMITGFSYFMWQAPLVGVFSYLAFINLFLGIINLIPAYPLDGGRIFRAFLWHKIKDLRKATKIASDTGRVFAGFLIFLGFWIVINGDLLGFWYVFIGVFLYNAAKMGYEYVLYKKAMTRLSLKDIMHTDIIRLNSDMNVADAVKKFFLNNACRSLPVFEGDNFKGTVSIDRIKQIPAKKREKLKVADIIQPIKKSDIVQKHRSLSSVLSKMTDKNIERIYIVDDENLIGMVDKDDILKILKLKIDLGV